MLLIEGKLTSLEEFRIQKDIIEKQIKEANESLKKRPGIARTSGARAAGEPCRGRRSIDCAKRPIRRRVLD